MFSLLGRGHTVTGYSNALSYEIDAGIFILELDSMGMIYGHSLNWPGGYSYIHTNNDSLNLLIGMSISAAYRPEPVGTHYDYSKEQEALKQSLER